MDKLDKTSFLGSITTVIVSLNLEDWGVILGILFGLVTLLLNWYYKDKEIKLKEKYLEKQLTEPKEQHNEDQ